MLHRIIFSFVMIGLLATSSISQAENSHTWGIAASLLTPTPGGYGINVMYEPHNMVRVRAGFASLGFLSTYGVGAQVFAFPEYVVRPFVGVQINHTHYLDVVSGFF